MWLLEWSGYFEIERKYGSVNPDNRASSASLVRPPLVDCPEIVVTDEKNRQRVISMNNQPTAMQADCARECSR
jgi:hypothetical protein